MNPLEEFTTFEYFHLISLPFVGVHLVEIQREKTESIFCSKCGAKAKWEPITKSSHLPMFDPTTGDRYQYDGLVCPTMLFSWKAWKTGFKTHCMCLMIFRRAALKRSV